MEIPLTTDGQSYLSISTDTLQRLQYISDLESDLQSQINSKSDNTTIANILGVPPENLNSLQKLAFAVGNDENYNTTIQGQLNLKADLASPNFTGTPTCPDSTAGDNTTKIANCKFVSQSIADLVASAPSTLDTLNELSTALGNDPNFATTMTNSLAGKAGLTTLNTFTNKNVFNNIDVSSISEKISIAGAPAASGVVSVDYSSNAIYHYTPVDDTATLVLDITNVPTTDTNKTYVMTILWDASTYKQKFVGVNINSTSRTLLFEGDNSVDLTASSLIIQRFVIIHTTNASIPTYVISSVSTFA